MAWIFKKDYQTNTTNEQIQKEAKLLIYPNPAINQLTLEVKTEEVLEYEVISILGKTLLSGFVSSDKQIIDISELASNIYFIKIENQLIKFLKIK